MPEDMPEDMSEDKDTLFARLAVERGVIAQRQLDKAREVPERGARRTLLEEPGRDRIAAGSAVS